VGDVACNLVAHYVSGSESPKRWAAQYRPTGLSVKCEWDEVVTVAGSH